MAFMDDALGRVVDAAGTVGRAALIPWGGAEACVDAVSDAQLTIARTVEVEPVRAVLASYSEMTRDIGATHLSRLRWLLDV
jgi:hypothetical protein